MPLLPFSKDGGTVGLVVVATIKLYVPLVAISIDLIGLLEFWFKNISDLIIDLLLVVPADPGCPDVNNAKANRTRCLFTWSYSAEIGSQGCHADCSNRRFRSVCCSARFSNACAMSIPSSIHFQDSALRGLG